jgi:hypothetical protein
MLSSINNLGMLQENCKPDMVLVSGLKVCKINIAGYSLDNFKTFDPTGYTVLCRLGENCDALSFFPRTSKIVLNVGEQSQISCLTFQNVVPNIAKDLAIPEEDAFQTAVDFFSDKKMVVQPVGIQGKIFRLMQNAQNVIPMMYTSQAVTTLKTTGLTGVQIINQAPLTFVGATYIGALFFGYCGSIAGNNTLGFVLNSTSYLLSRPMRGLEIVLNGLVLRPVSHIVGMPFILNGTQEMISGKGLSIAEYGKIAVAFERLTNSTVVQKIKKIYKIIRSKE